MDECKTKAIQTNLGTFRHNQTYPGIIQAYLEHCFSLKFHTYNCGISRTLTFSEPEAYSEPRHIHNPGIFRTPIYSECWHIQNLRYIQNPVVHLR